MALTNCVDLLPGKYEELRDEFPATVIADAVDDLEAALKIIKGYADFQLVQDNHGNHFDVSSAARAFLEDATQ